MKPTFLGVRIIPLAAVPAALTTWFANSLAWTLAWLATRFIAMSDGFTEYRIEYRGALRLKKVRASYYHPRAEVVE